MAIAFKRAINYWSTYYLLVKDYIAYLGAKAIPLLSSVVVAGLLYPLPFAIMASAVYAMMGGHQTSTIHISEFKAKVGVDSAFLYSLVFAGVTLTFNYLAQRAALTATTAWQTSLLWRAVNQLPVMSRWDTETIVPMPLRPGRLGSFLTSLVRSGFLVGRIVAVGFSNFVIALGALLVITWLDPISVAVLIVVSILWLPLYAWAMLGTVSIRGQRSRRRQQEQVLFKQMLQEIISGLGRHIDTPQLTLDDKRRFESGYGSINAQLQGLNLVSLIVGLHVFSSIAIIYLINGASLSTFVRDKIVFFVILLFMMRAALSLVLLISRLSRGYTSLATLRAYLHPRRKKLHPMPQAPADAVFALRDSDSGVRYALCKGDPAFVVMPNASHAFELLPLSNALEILKMPGEALLRHIVFLHVAELKTAIHGGTVKSSASMIDLSEKRQSLQLPIRHAAFDREQLGVVALSQDAWELLVESGEAEDFCRDRIAFVVVADPKRPKPPSPETVLVVSDCVDIIAVGAFAETWERSAEEAFQQAAKEEIKVDLADEEMV